MIPATYIKRNIGTIAAGYKAAKSPLQVLLHAKLAIIEVGGWVETSMDDVVLRCGKKLKDKKNNSYVKDDIVKNTWGFDYTKHFRQMLIRVVGLVSVERIEAEVDGAKFAKMIAALKMLKTARHNVAHTYVKHVAVTAPIPAPNVVASYFNDIYVGLKDIEGVIKKLKLI